MKVIYKDTWEANGLRPNDVVLLEILRLNNDNAIKSVTVSMSEFEELMDSIIRGDYWDGGRSIKIKCHFAIEEYVLMLSTHHIDVYVDANL